MSDSAQYLRVVAFDVGVGVPLAAGAHVELHEADAALDEAAGHQAVAAVGGGGLIVDAVEVERFGGFVRDVGRFRRGGLHAVGELVGGDAGFEVFIVLAAGQVLAIELLNVVDRVALAGVGVAFGRRDVEDRRFAVAELGALVGGGHEASAPLAAAGGRQLRVVAEHDVAGEVVALAA